MKSTQGLFGYLAITGVLLIASPAANAANPTGAPQSPPDLKALDINQDGNVSKDEFMALGGSEESFQRSDANSDKNLDQGELEKALIISRNPNKAEQP